MKWIALLVAPVCKDGERPHTAAQCLNASFDGLTAHATADKRIRQEAVNDISRAKSERTEIRTHRIVESDVAVMVVG